MKLHSNRRAYEKRRRMPKNAQTKNPKVILASLAAIVISIVILCMVVIIGVIGVTTDQTASADPQKAVSSAEGPLHAWFFMDSSEARDEAGTYEMDGAFVLKDGVSYLPADGIAAVLGGHIDYNKEKGTVKFKEIGSRAKVTVGSETMKASLFKKVTMSVPAYEENGVVYVPARDFFEGLGYGISYTAPSKRLDVFALSDGEDALPTASFTTDKDAYSVGEKVIFDATGSSPLGYEIVEEKWENHAPWYFESGEVTISYSVKDYKGNWSEPVSKTITVEGEYYADESVPVLSYYYIVEDASRISKVVTEEKETKEKDPSDPTGLKEIVKKEKVKKTVKGPYYDDDMVISLDQFKEEMNILADNGVHTLTVSEYLDYADSGVMPPENSVLILFVNGYASTYDLAYPVLKELGLKANIAPEVSLVEKFSAAAGDENALKELEDASRFPVVTFDQLKEMIAEGTFDVGCISYSSNRYGDDAALLAAPTGDETEEDYAARVKSDVTTAITVLCEQLGEQHKPFFIYPYGETSDVLVSAVQNAGFSAAFAKGDNGCIDSDSDRYGLGRMSVTQSMSKSKFKDLVN